ncbi:outer membrane beta-barrel protein [Vibrio splendidus]|uniref:outer membrane beta-barrel protein n=1 Tax=Vibrio splendidus TaxID=29497 RepID=UPI00076A9989|nr:outer membrane beta-barrel protein [Vibrio splendidus]
MKKMNLIPSFIVLFLSISASASADQLPIQMSGGMTFSAFDDNMGQTEALGYRASMGYHINENVIFELGYADFSAFSDPEIDSLRAVMVETDLLLPVSDFASFYAGLGGALSSNDTNLTASLGLQYQLSQNWYADLGYQGVFDLVRQNDDLYAFNVQMIYRFSSNNPKDDISDFSPRPSVEKQIEEPTQLLTPEPQVAPIVPVKKEPICQQSLIEYRVASGDHLSQLARKFEISFDELIEENKNLNNRDLNLIYPGEIIVYTKTICLN